jgi:putative ABC transport system permease protein
MDSLIAANIKQRPLRTAISMAGVALGVILVVLVVGLARGTMRDSAERQTNVDAEIRFYPEGYVSPTSANPLSLPERYADAIRHGVQPTPDNPYVTPRPPVPDVVAATAVGEWIQNSEGGIGFGFVDGIDYPSFVGTTQLRVVEGRALSDGRAPGSEREAIVDRYYSDVNRGTDGQPVRIGSTITVLSLEFKVVGIYEPSLLGRVKIPLHTMQQIFGGAENCSFVMVRTEGPEVVEQVKKTLEEFYPGHKVVLTRDMPALYAQGIRPVEIFLDAVIGLAVVISMLVILLAMYTTIIERTREIGILKSLGASKLFIIMAIEKEAALLSALGVLLGYACAIAGKYLIESSTKLTIDLQPRWLLIAAGIGILGGVVGAIYPAVRAANLDPIEAISYE